MEFSFSQLVEVEALADQGYTIEAIALHLDIDIAVFTIYCLEANHVLCKAYQKGVLSRKKTLNKKLEDKARDGSVTAHQILEKQQTDQAFLDAKRDMFSDIDFMHGEEE